MPRVADHRTEIAAAANRRRQPKNVWDMVLLPFTAAGAWVVLAWPILSLRRAGMPSNAFMQAPASEFSFLVFVLGIGLASIGPGLILSNWISSAIAPPSEQQRRATTQANRGLIRFSLVILLAVYPISLAGGLNYFALAPDGVHYRHYLSAQPTIYAWDEIRRIRSQCYRRRAPTGHYTIVFDDGRSVDLAAYSEKDFFAAYPRLSDSLRQAPAIDFSFDLDGSASCPASWRRYFARVPRR